MKSSFSVRWDQDSWPTAEQKLLLQACLLTGAGAMDAWAKWRKSVDFEQLDEASLRMVPLLYHNLRRCGAADPDMARYQAVHKRTWYRNQHLLHRAAGILARLNEAGIETLVLKGAALACAYYEDVGLRAMDDCDMLVPTERASDAIGVFFRAGWRPDPQRSQRELETRDVPKRHGWNFLDANGFGVDLHWRVLGTSAAGDAELERGFWTRARPLRVGHVDTLTLDAADHLLHTCVHGIAWNRVPAMRWVADASKILVREGKGIGWDRVVEQIRERRLAVIMAHSLTYLQREFAAPIPDEVIASIGDIPVSRWEWEEFRAMTSSRAELKRRYHLWHRFLRFRHTSPEWRRGFVGFSYLRYIRMHWELEHAGQIPVAMLKKAAAGIGRKAFEQPESD